LIESIFSTQQQENRGEQCKNKENQLSRKKKKKDVLFSVLSPVIAQTCGGGSQLLQQIISPRNNDFFLF